MNILVTGATGAVGKEIISHLANLVSVKIMTINRNTSKASALFTQPNIANISTNELEKIESFDPNYIIHLATLYTSRNDSDIIEPIIEANILFGIKLLDALKNCRNIIAFLNFGTFAEYGNSQKQIDNIYLYSATKTAFRVFLNYYSTSFNFKYVHIVPYTIYGGKDEVKKIIDYIYDSLNSHEPVKTTLGLQELDFIHIEDVTEFVTQLIYENKVMLAENGETIYLGTGKPTSIRKIAELFETYSGLKCNLTWGALPYRDRDIMKAIAPSESLVKYNFRPTIDIEQGIKKYLKLNS